MPRFDAADGVQRVCAFWRVDALARIGRIEQARESFEALLLPPQPDGACCRRISTRRAARLWGNFPQTYSMVGIINGAMLRSKPWSVAV